jgi:anti-sigma regulatory factor (Ser/Thr protein kinase)
MQSDESASTSGEAPPTSEGGGLRTELDDLRQSCRSQARVIDTLTAAVTTLRRGATALKAENAELRTENARMRRGQRSRPTLNGFDGGAVIEVRLPLDLQAPAAARTVVGRCLSARFPATLVENARLLVSELVTNSVRHSGASSEEGVTVRAQIGRSMLRLEVEDPGRDGVIALQPPDVEIGAHLGLNLVEALSERWGALHMADGGTRVWAQLTCAPGPVAGSALH